MVSQPHIARTPGVIRRARRLDLAELVIGYGLILSVVWTPGTPQRVLYWTTFAWIAVTAWLRRKDHETNGLGLRGLVPSLWVVGLAVLIFLVAIPIARAFRTLHPLYGVVPVGLHIAGYAVWALMQQFILQIYVLLRLLRLGMRRAPAVLLSALLFATAHIPNPLLTGLTIVWGMISCLLFLRYRNLYTLAVAHGILGMCLAVTTPNSIHHHMRVGLGYIKYHRHPHYPHHRTLISP